MIVISYQKCFKKRMNLALNTHWVTRSDSYYVLSNKETSMTITRVM